MTDDTVDTPRCRSIPTERELAYIRLYSMLSLTSHRHPPPVLLFPEVASLCPKMMSRIISLATTATFLFLAASPFTDSVLAQKARVIQDCTTPNTVALTFDDGPYIYMDDIVTALDAAGATGTFFVNGNNYACIYDDESSQRLINAVAHGHQIASKTWSNSDLTTLSFDQINDEMRRGK